MADIRDAERALQDAADRALRIIAEDLLGRSQRIVLLAEGTLAGSGHTEPERGVHHDGRERSIAVVYSTPYARRRHEETHTAAGVPIQPSVPGRQPKFLEAPLKAMAGRYQAALAEAIRRGMPDA